MSTKHTPGNWQVLPEEADCDYIRVRGTRLDGRYKVANVLVIGYEGLPEKLNEREAIETRANARLIAAAPDLLAALQCIVSDYEFCKNGGFGDRSAAHAETAAKAIAKATGEQA